MIHILFSLLISDISAAARAQIEPTNNATAGIPNGPHGYKVHSLESMNPTLCTLSFWVFVDLPRCNEAVRGIRALWRGTARRRPDRDARPRRRARARTRQVGLLHHVLITLAYTLLQLYYVALIRNKVQTGHGIR